MAGSVTAIYRYPVKGLSAEPLDRIAVEAGSTLPFDRAWAIENGPGRFDPEKPAHLPKICFLMLMRDEGLAALESRFDPASKRLRLFRAGRQVASGDLTTRTGRQIIEQFLAAYMASSLRGAPRILHAEGHSFTDTRAKGVHIVNLATVRELERVMARPVDPRRFRPNVVVDGFPPWAELDWPGRTISAGGIRLEVTAPTERCAATNVDPATGVRDLDIPAVLLRKWQHTNFGVYAKIANDGVLAVGDAVTD